MNLPNDCLLLISSDSHGNPQVGGAYGHIVYWSPDAGFTPVNQMQAGGRFPNEDCFIGSSQMAGLRRGIRIPTLALETAARTTATYGTDMGLGAAALGNWLPCHWGRGDPPNGGFIGNPAWGGKLQGDAAYLAASLHVLVIIDAPLGAVPVDNPQPTGGTLIPEDPDAMTNDTALGLARLVADSLFGRPGLGIDTVNAIASDIVSKGLVEAMDKWGAVAQQNGEVGLVGRVANRAKIDQSKP